MITLASILDAAPAVPAGGGGRGSKSPWVMLGAGLFFMLVAGTQAVNPRLLWRMNKWQYKNPEANEPSEKGFLVQRIIGGAIAVVGLVLVIVAITKI